MSRWMAVCVAVVFASGSVLGQEKAPASAPAPDVGALKTQKADLEKQRGDLQAKWNERSAALAKQDAVAKAAAAADEAEAKYRKFLQTDPKLEDLRKGQQAAERALQAAIDKAAAEDKEGAANRETRASLVKTGYVQEYDIGVLDFEYERKVKRLVGEDQDVVNARSATWKTDQAVRDLDSGDPELQALRQKVNAARHRLTRAQEDARTEAYQQAAKALHDANKAYGDAVAALASRRTAEEKRTEADKLYKAKVAADDEAKSLRAEQARLLKERAELDYQIALVEHKLQTGPTRRVSRDPEVAKANDASYRAEAAFRQETEADPKVAAARKAQQDAQKQFQVQEQAVSATQGVADAAKALDAAEKALDAARKTKLAKPQEDTAAARKKEGEVFAAKLAADAAGKAVAEKRAGIAGARDADLKRMQELDAAYLKVRERVSKEHPDVAKARQAVTDANAAYDKGVKESEGPALDKARQDARNEARKAFDSAIAGDEACKALRQQLDALAGKIRDIDRDIRKAEAPPKPVAAPEKTGPANK